MFLAAALALSITTSNAQLPDNPRMDWWREAKFGMFIHWGLYAVPAGEWNGATNHAEWIRETAPLRGARHELRDPLRPGRADGVRPETTFLPYQPPEEMNRQVVRTGGFDDFVFERTR